MAAMNAKRWVMAAVLAGGLAAGVGGVWQANAQDKPGKADPNKVPDTNKAAEELDRLKKELQAEEAKLREAEERLKQKALAEEKAREAERAAKDKYAKWPEFMYLPQAADYAPTAEEFEKTVRKAEVGGYKFVGLMPITGYSPERKGAGPVPTLIFRRVVDKGAAFEDVTDKDKRLKMKEAADGGQKVRTDQLADQEYVLQAEIESLKMALAELRGNKKGAKADDRWRATFQASDLGGTDYESAAKVASALLRLKFGDDALKKVEIEPAGKSDVTVTGQGDEGHKYTQWLTDQVKALKGEKPQGK